LFRAFNAVAGVGVVGVRAGGELNVAFSRGTNDDYDDYDGTRMIRIKRINTDDVSLEMTSTKLTVATVRL